MNKCLSVFGLCALLSAGSLLSASETPAPAGNNAEPEIAVSGPALKRPPQRFGLRRPEKNFAALWKNRQLPGARCQISGKKRGCMGFQMPGACRRRLNGQHCPMFRKNNRFDIFHRLIPRVPMNEDEKAKFAELKMDVRDALQTYRSEKSEANTAALRTSVEKLVSAAQQYEIERCEKALARAKAAVARKDKIVERTIKKLTAPPRPGKAMPRPLHRAK